MSGWAQNVITNVITRRGLGRFDGRRKGDVTEAERFEDTMLLALKVEEGIMSQRM